MIGEIPEYLLDVPNYSCALYDVSNFDAEYRQSWACELYKIFFGVYESPVLSISTDKDGNIIPYEELSIDFDISKDVFGPAIFDSSYPYIGFPKKYLNYVKGNLIVKFLKSSCYEKKDEDYSIYYICNKTYIELEKNYISFLI